MSELTPLQRRFCQEYAACLNATQAYRRAGYQASTDAVAASSASKLLRNGKIRAYLDEIASLTQARVINEVALIAFADITDVCEFDANGVSIIPSDELSDRGRAALKKVRHRTVTRIAPDGTEVTTTEIEVELHDKLSALDKLIRKTCGGYPSSMQLLDAVKVLANNNVLTASHADVVIAGVERIEDELRSLSGVASGGGEGAPRDVPTPGAAIREALGLV